MWNWINYLLGYEEDELKKVTREVRKEFVEIEKVRAKQREIEFRKELVECLARRRLSVGSNDSLK